MEAVRQLHRWWMRWLSAFVGIEQDAGSALPLAPAADQARPRDYLTAALVCAGVTVLASLLRDALAPANLILLYLMAVAWVSVRLGLRPGILASFVSVLAFDFFFVPPYYSFTVEDTQYLLTFAIMLAVSLTISTLTANLRHIARIAHFRERRTAALFELSRDLSSALTPPQIVDIAIRHLKNMFQAEATIFLPDRQGRIHSELLQGTPSILAVLISDARVREAYAQQGFPAPEIFGTGTEPMHPVHYVPLRAPMRNRGVLAILPEDPRQLAHPEQQRVLQTFAAQIALAIERVHYVDIARETEVAMKSEQLRNSLLSALSHDVRTPLTAIIGLSSTLTGAPSTEGGHRQEIAEAIQEEALRMNGLVTNLLDMARLHAGGVRLNRHWQFLEEVIGSSIRLLSRTLKSRPVDVTLAPDLPLLEFDAVLIERVLCNLLANVAKHTPAGSACRIEARRVDAEVEIAVVDTGAGIADGMAQVIFDKFVRAERETARVGAGLGLSICRAIVEAHGGRIRAENAAGGGARFVFTLPAGSPPAARAPDDVTASGDGGAQ